MSEKRCVIALKRQHIVEEDEDTQDMVLDTSVIQNASFQKPDSSSESESESDVSACRIAATSQVPKESDIPTDNEEGVHSPVPGPSTNEADDAAVRPEYEDITQPLATSTPHHQGPEEVQEEEVIRIWEVAHIRDAKRKVRQGRKILKNIKKDYLSAVRRTLKTESEVFMPQLVERRSELTVQLNDVDNQIKALNILRESILYQRGEVDSEIDSYRYFIDNFPEIVQKK